MSFADVNWTFYPPNATLNYIVCGQSWFENVLTFTKNL